MSEPQASRRLRLGLRPKLILLATLVSAVPMALVGWLLIDINKSALRESLREHFFTVIDNVSQDIDGSLVATQNTLDACARVLADQDTPVAARLSLARALVAGDASISVVGIYDRSGAAVDAIREAGSDTELPKSLPAELVETAIRDGRAVGAAVTEGDSVQVPVIVPVRTSPGQTMLAVTYAGLEPVQKRVEEFADRRLGRRQHLVMVVDESGRAVAHTDREISDQLASVTDDPLAADLAGAKVGDAMVFRHVTAGSRPYVSATGSVADLPWAVVVALPEDVAYESFARMRSWVIGVVLGIIFLATLIATVLAHRITSPIRALVGFAGELANRRFDKRVTLNTGDELQVLGDALSNAAVELEDSDRRIREETSIRTDLGRYLPGQLVDRIVDREEKLELGGERREITVLFADVAGFTPLIEQHSAETVVSMLNELFTVLTEIVFRHGGTVDKFVGDCVMAFWGAPNPQEDHAQLALRAAEDMVRFLEVSNVGFSNKYGFEIELAIGVNSGEAVVGNFGSETRMEYTAIGDVVNVAARLEALARPNQIVISKATADAAGDGFDYAPLGTHRLAGKSDDVELFEVQA
ncbi:MAG: hypothetical protein KJO07_12595 [Deltaproteobacteria bacterium]|nr:hypothetical protein [Deltaproteobacteria bacterium]